MIGAVVVGMDHHHTNQPAISVRNLTKTWASGVEAVKGVTFDVPAGQAELVFRHSYNLQSNSDGGVLPMDSPW